MCDGQQIEKVEFAHSVPPCAARGCRKFSKGYGYLGTLNPVIIIIFKAKHQESPTNEDCNFIVLSLEKIEN